MDFFIIILICFLRFTYNVNIFFCTQKNKQINIWKNYYFQPSFLIGHCYDWLTSLHRKPYQHPLTIACKCFDNINPHTIRDAIKNKLSTIHADIVLISLQRREQAV